MAKSPSTQSTILAALRCYQQQLNMNDGVPPQNITDIATNGGKHEPMTVNDIDYLCEQINS